MEVENREEYSTVGDECEKTLCTRYIKHLQSGVGILKRFACFVEVSDSKILQSELTLDSRSGYTKQTIF